MEARLGAADFKLNVIVDVDDAHPSVDANANVDSVASIGSGCDI